MRLQAVFVPVVISSLVMSQGYGIALAQAPAQQPAPPTAQQPAPAPAQQILNNDAIIKLVKAGLSDDLIVNTINTSPGNYDVSAEGIIALKTGGASDRVIAAMVAKANPVAQPAPAPAPAPRVAPAPPPAPAPAPAPGPAVPPGMSLLTEGTEVYLEFDQDVSSKTAHDGDPVEFVLAEDLVVGNVVVARAGAKAFGEVLNAERSGMMGKGGDLSVRVDHLKVGAYKIHLRGSKGAAGKDSVGGTIALTMLVGVFGIFHHGKEVVVQKGQKVTVYVSDDIALPPAA